MSKIATCFATAFAAMVAAERASADCDTILHAGLYNYRQTNSSEQLANNFAQSYCQDEMTSSQDNSQLGAKLGVPIEDVPVQFGWDQNENHFGTWHKDFCHKLQTDSDTKTKFNQTVYRIEPAVIDGFNKCIATRGLHFWIDETLDSRRYVLNFSYIPVAEAVPAAKITKITGIDKKDCLSGFPTKVFQSAAVICKRSAKDAVTVAIQSDPSPIDGSFEQLPAAAVPVVQQQHPKARDPNLIDGRCIILVSEGSGGQNTYLDAMTSPNGGPQGAYRSVYMSPTTYSGTVWKLKGLHGKTFELGNQGKADMWLDGAIQVPNSFSSPLPMNTSRVSLAASELGVSVRASWKITKPTPGDDYYILESQDGSGTNRFLDGYTIGSTRPAYLVSSTVGDGTHWQIIPEACP